MRPWITLSLLLPPTLSPRSPSLSFSQPVSPSCYLGEQHSRWTSTVCVLQSEPIRTYSRICHRISNSTQEGSARSHWGLLHTPGWGFRWHQLNHTECQFSLGQVLRDWRWIYTAETMFELKVWGSPAALGIHQIISDGVTLILQCYAINVKQLDFSVLKLRKKLNFSQFKLKGHSTTLLCLICNDGGHYWRNFYVLVPTFPIMPDKWHDFTSMVTSVIFKLHGRWHGVCLCVAEWHSPQVCATWFCPLAAL